MQFRPFLFALGAVSIGFAQEPKQKTADGPFDKQVIRTPARIKTTVTPGSIPAATTTIDDVEIVELCDGVAPDFTPASCVRLGADGTQLFCNVAAKPVYVLDAAGIGASVVPADRCLYDCKSAACRTNEKRVQPEAPAIHPYRVDAVGMRANPKYPKLPRDVEGVIALRASLLGRNWDRDSADDWELGDGTFDTFRIRVIHKRKLAGLLPPDFDLEGRLAARNQEFIYTKGGANEEARELLLKTLIAQGAEHPNVTLLGAYLNRKSGWHWVSEKFKGEPAVECETAGCDLYGPQAIAYDDKTYGIASWSTFKDLYEGETLVFTVVTGDGGPTRDDLIGFFQVSVGNLRAQKRILHVQKNPKGGTDLVLMFELELAPRFD